MTVNAAFPASLEQAVADSRATEQAAQASVHRLQSAAGIAAAIFNETNSSAEQEE